MIRRKKSAAKPGRQGLEREKGNRGRGFMEAMQKALDRVKMPAASNAVSKPRKLSKGIYPTYLRTKRSLVILAKATALQKVGAKARLPRGGSG